MLKIKAIWRRLVLTWKNWRIKFAHDAILTCRRKMLEQEDRMRLWERNFDQRVGDRNRFAQRHGLDTKKAPEPPKTPAPTRLNPQRSIEIH